MAQKIIIVDYSMGNLNSVRKMISLLGFEAAIATKPEEISKADKIIFPGVGHFKKAMENLEKLKLKDALNEMVINRKKPLLGICLGMQLLANYSEEGDYQGLGWVDANVVKFQVSDSIKFKVPHTGWNTIEVKKNSSLMQNVPNYAEFYFVHSYHLKCNNEKDILNISEYDYEFVSAIERDNIFGVQYHPEKSHGVGKILLNNFIKM